MATDKLLEWLDTMEQQHSALPTINVREIAYHTDESVLTVKLIAAAAGWTEAEVNSDLMHYRGERHAAMYWQF